MRKGFDVSKLTAYALGELAGPERAEIAALVEESPEVRGELDEIEAAATLLRQALVGVPRHELTDAQRAALEAEARKATVVRFPLRRLLFAPGGLAAAAALVLIALVSWQALRERGSRSSIESPLPARAPAVTTSGTDNTLAATSPHVEGPTPPAAASARRDRSSSEAATDESPLAVRRPVGGVVPEPTLDRPPSPHLPSVRSEEVSPAESAIAHTEVAHGAPVAIALPTPKPGGGSTGGLRGTVVDPSKSVIVGASVTVANERTYVVQRTSTGSEGGFVVTGLPAGEYRATIERPGFKTAERIRIEIAAGQARDLGTWQLATRERADGIAAESGAATAKGSHGAGVPAAGTPAGAPSEDVAVAPVARSTGGLKGKVTDPAKAVVAGARVTLLSEATGLTRKTSTNADGMFTFADLPVGHYKITVEQLGFRTAVNSEIRLETGQMVNVDFELESAETTEAITGAANAVPVETLADIEKAQALVRPPQPSE